MSLDIYLKTVTPVERKSTGIFIRRDGQTVELSLEEAKLMYADNAIGEETYLDDNVFHANLTHNLVNMATHVEVDASRGLSLYDILWDVLEIGYDTAKHILVYLCNALTFMRENEAMLKEYNPKNGWGTYELLYRVVKEYSIACIEYPDATIEISR